MDQHKEPGARKSAAPWPDEAFIPDRAALQTLLDDTLNQVMNLLQADAGAVFVSDQRAQALILTSHRGLSPAFVAKEARLPFGTCMCGHTIDACEPVYVVEDVRRDPRCVVGSCFEDGFVSLLCLPLCASGRVWGLLRLHGREPAALDRSQSRLLTFISSQLGLAIERARLQESVAHLLQQVEEERATLHSLVHSLIDGLILVDGEGRIAYWNLSTERYLSLEGAALLGQDLVGLADRILAAAEEPHVAAGQLRRAVDAADTRPLFEFQVRSPAPRTLQARLFPIEGRKGYGIVLRDVTAERHLDDLKSQLLSTVSHELRTPLASIKGFATTLLREDVQWDSAAQREFLQIIDQESDRLGELIANLLEMSRIEAGVLRIDRTWIALPPLLEDALAEMRLRAPEHRLVLDLPEGLPEVYADGRRIRQILHNLLENAIKYSAGGEVRLSAHSDGRQVVISVLDHGIGIAADHLPRIFDRFYRVDSSPARRKGGTGLGLSICKGLVEAHGGRIWAESTPGVGSVFHFSLPIGNREAAEES